MAASRCRTAWAEGLYCHPVSEMRASFFTPSNVDGGSECGGAVERLSYLHLPGSSPGVLFCPGFRSSMRGLKSQALWTYCSHVGREYTCFDYFDHGESYSTGEPSSHAVGTIGRWRRDTVEVLDEVTKSRKQIIVGSSMGGWLMILAALARPHRVAALLGIASAPDFTRAMKGEIESDGALSDQLERLGYCDVPTVYEGGGHYRIYQEFIREAEEHVLLDGSEKIDVGVPVRLLHGRCDEDVSWHRSRLLVERLGGKNVELQIVEDGDHRLSRPEDLDHIVGVLDELVRHVSAD